MKKREWLMYKDPTKDCRKEFSKAVGSCSGVEIFSTTAKSRSTHKYNLMQDRTRMECNIVPVCSAGFYSLKGT